MHKYIIFILTLLFTLPVAAQTEKKDIQKVKTNLKAGKDLEASEKILQNILKNPQKVDSTEVLQLLADVIRKEYEMKNEQLYLRTLKDTASVFPVMRRMFDAYEVLDSADARPDSKGTVKIRYRKKNAEYLNNLRRNLFSGAVFNMRKKNYSEAFACADSYLACEQQPLFSEYNYAVNDTLRTEMANTALTAAVHMKNHPLTVRYADIALQHPQKAHSALMHLHQSYLSVGDTISAVRCLHEGFNRFPEANYFFPRLADYYMQRGEVNVVDSIVGKALELEPGNLFFRMAYNTVLLNTERYDECIAQGDSLLHSSDQMTLAYLNVGTACYNKAMLVEKSRLSSRTKRQKANDLYKQALPYLERYRKERPKRISEWGDMLYNIYLNLNMGKEFEELDALMKGTK